MTTDVTLPQTISGVGEMPSRKCPYCKVVSNFSDIWDQPPPGNPDHRIAIEQCQNCSNWVYYRLLRSDINVVIDVYPSVETDPDEALPEAVKIALREAYKALESEIWNACVLMSRRALEEAVTDMQAVGRDLFTQIDDLAEKQKITPALKEWAHEGRLGGNLGAHGTEEKKWADQQDAEEILEFTKWFLRYAYVLPGQLAERRGEMSSDNEDDSLPDNPEQAN